MAIKNNYQAKGSRLAPSVHPLSYSGNSPPPCPAQVLAGCPPGMSKKSLTSLVLSGSTPYPRCRKLCQRLHAQPTLRSILYPLIPSPKPSPRPPEPLAVETFAPASTIAGNGTSSGAFNATRCRTRDTSSAAHPPATTPRAERKAGAEGPGRFRSTGLGLGAP